MKKMARKLSVLLMAAMLAGSMSACSSTGNGVAKYGNKEISTEEAEFWLRFEQWNTESYYWAYYEYMGVENMWQSAYSETQTMGDYLHTNTMAEILQMNILRDHMADYQIEGLTDAQNAKVTETLDEFYEVYPKFMDHVSATKEQITEYMIENAEASLVAQAVKDAADVTVEEDEYKKYGIQSIIVSAPSEDTEEEETEETEEEAGPEGMELVNALLQAINDGTDIQDAADQYGVGVSNGSFLLTGETSTDVRYNATKDLKAGEVTMVENGSSGWYVVVRTNDYDEDASETMKNSLIEEKQTEAFNETYAEWAKAAPKFSVNEDKWGKLTVTEKIYEVEEETEAATEAE